jgi:DNA (cytosine-5)-methyltransferase 1
VTGVTPRLARAGEARGDRPIIIDGFAGPGGWDVAAARLGLSPVVGIEIDAAACATRAAAGHLTIRADISRYPAEALAGRVSGSAFSPVCTTFSAAGKRAGVAVLNVLDASIRDVFEGGRTRAAHRREMARMLRKAWWPNAKLTRAERSAAIWKAVRSASLVVEPARFIYACRPEWVAMEQVREVLPLWEVYAEELRRLGYSAWCGVLNAADYGVPQTRMRAILIASRTRQVYRPDPTHYDPRKGDQLFGTPWVSMAEALGWGATGRPAPTTTAGGTTTGGAEPFGRGGREALELEQGAGRWALRIDAQAHASVRDVTAPALKFGHSAAEMQWVLHANRDQKPDGTRQTADPQSAPALTAKSGGQWVMRRQVGATRSEGRRSHPPNEPAPAITGGGSAAGSGNGTGLIWVRERPATTLQCDERLFAPHAGSRGEHQSADSVRITPTEAAILQSFDAGYPWQGTKTKVFEQIGNAVPPLLAEHVLAMAAGIDRAEVAA